MKNRFTHFLKSFVTFDKGLYDVVKNKGPFCQICYVAAIVPGSFGLAIVLLKLAPSNILLCFGFEQVHFLLSVIYLFLLVTVGYYLSRVLVWWFYLLYIFSRKKTSKSEFFQVPDKSKFLVVGGAGPGRCYSVINGKECIYVPLAKIDTDNPSADLLVDDNTEPILYNGYSIFCIKRMLFLYTVLIDGGIYFFDIRDLAKMSGLLDPQEEMHSIIGNKRNWLREFFKRLEDSPYFFDIENNFK